MNDIHVTLFMLLTLIAYIKYKKDPQNKKLFITGLLAGLAMGSKWSGLLILLIVWLLESIHWLKKTISKKITWNDLVNHGLLMVLALGLLPLIIYLMSYGQMFSQGKDWNHFTRLHQQTWWYQTNLEATHTYQSQPWQWFLNLKPVWFHVNYLDNDSIANIYSFGNPAFHFAGVIAVFLTIFFLLIHKIGNHSRENIEFLNLLLVTYFLSWLPWQLSPRIMFFYHYTPAVALLSIIIAYWLVKIWFIKVKPNSSWNKITVLATVSLIFLSFVIWFPHWTAIPMPQKFINNVYFLIPSWK